MEQRDPTAAVRRFAGHSLIRLEDARRPQDAIDRAFLEVVGVVEDTRPARLADPRQPELLTAMPLRSGLSRQWLSLLMRTRGSPEALVPTLRALLRELDQALASAPIRTMDGLLGDSLARPRLYSVLVGTFAVCALAIVGVGLFGVLSYAVTQRRREFGVRMALGARPADVARLIGRRALGLVGFGLALGFALSLASGHALEGLLWGVRPHDVPGLLGVVLAIALVAVLASFVPAARAARLDPQRILRDG